MIISSLFLLLIYLADYKGSTLNIIAAVAAGAGFWIFLILGCILFAVMNVKRKKYQKSRQNKAEADNKSLEGKSSRVPGIFRFFSNKLAAAADIFMIIFFVLIMLSLFIPAGIQNLLIAFIALFIISLQLHCVLNGVNFTYINSIREGA